MKAQGIRVLDVFVVGPAMIAGGSMIYRHAPPERRPLGALLIGTGIATMIYNGNNWLKVEAQLDAEQERAAAEKKRTTPGTELAPRE